jgi:uncharacterized membrane protein YkoI
VIGATAAWQVQRESTQNQQAELRARATISESQARQTALASVRGGRIAEAELEEENGRLIYSFDIAGQNGTYDVEVDALTGQLLQSRLENDDADDDTDDGADDDERGPGGR